MSAAEAPQAPPPGAPEEAFVMPERYRLVISRLLLVGVVLSAVLIAIGLAAFLLRVPPADVTQGVRFRLALLVSELAHGDPRAVLWLGLVALVLTPLTRVIVSVVAFVRLRDTAFVALTGAVLVLLLVSAIVGGAS